MLFHLICWNCGCFYIFYFFRPTLPDKILIRLSSNPIPGLLLISELLNVILGDLVTFWGLFGCRRQIPLLETGKSEIDSLQYSRLQEVEPQPEIFLPCISICMNFTSWLLKKEIPDSDRLAMLIQQAGPNGLPETELRSGIELPKQLVDELLSALVDARMVRVAERNGMRWYFSPL